VIGDAGQEQLRVEPGAVDGRSAAHDHDAGQPEFALSPRTWSTSATASARAGAAGDGRRRAARHGRRGGIKHSVVQAFMQKFADNGKGYGPSEPLHTVMAGAPRHAVISAHLEQANGSPEGEKPLAGRSAEDPLSTIVAKGCTQRVVTSNLVKLRGTCAHGQSVDEPLATVSAQGTHIAEVRAFLLKYYGNESEGHDPERPLGTVTTKDRFGLVTVTIGARNM
jgi:hypothetical protein